MARSRNIKPGFFKNEHLAELEPLTRILFAGLWTVADREGRLEDRPRKIKAEILPYDDCDVDKLLDDLMQAEDPFIIRYEVNEKKYIQIINFNKHQNPHKNEAKSVIPPHTHEKHHTSTVQAPEKHNTNPADSLNLIPDSLSLDSLKSDSLESIGENSFADSQEVLEKLSKESKKAITKKEIEDNFEALWRLYPNKKGKGQVRDKTKLRLAEIGFDHINRCIDRYKKTKENWKEWQHGSTFFNSGYVDFLDQNYEEGGQHEINSGNSGIENDPYLARLAWK